MEKRQNQVTNAQLAAWIGVVPSTIQSWRRNEKRFSVAPEIRERLMQYINEHLHILHKPQTSAQAVEMLEAAYVEAGRPKAEVTGRDFTDPDRLDRHPLLSQRKTQK